MDNVLCQKPVLESSPRSRRRRRRLMGHPARAPRKGGRKEEGLLPGIDKGFARVAHFLSRQQIVATVNDTQHFICQIYREGL